MHANRHSILPSLIALVSIAFASCSRASAQCEYQWLNGMGYPGLNAGPTGSALWDPDGDGPLGTMVALIGEFWFAGDVAAARVVLFDPATGEWRRPPGNPTFPIGVGTLNAIAVTPDGDLLIGGNAINLNGVTMGALVRCDGSTWTSENVTGTVYTMLSLPSGELAVGGFAMGCPGLAGTHRIAKLTGSTWSTFGGGLGTASEGVSALAINSQGDLYAGGLFSTIPGVSAARGIAYWSNGQWSRFGTAQTDISFDQAIGTMAFDSNGTLVIGGTLTSSTSSAVRRVAQWDGAQWQSLGIPDTFSTVRVVKLLPDNRLLICGDRSGDSFVWTRSGSEWSSIGPFRAPVSTTSVFFYQQLPDGRSLISGNFYTAQGRWNRFLSFEQDGTLSRTVTGTDGDVNCFYTTPSGQFVVGGTFSLLEGAEVARVATLGGTTWQSMGYLNAAPNCFTWRQVSNTLVAASSTTLSSWTGTTWTNATSNWDGSIYCMAGRANGAVIMGGQLLDNIGHISNGLLYRHANDTWGLYGPTNPGGDVFAMLYDLPTGEVIIAGEGSLRVQRRLDPGAWSMLGTGFASMEVRSLLKRPDGVVWAGGTKIQVLNGTAWTTFATLTHASIGGVPSVRAMVEAPDGRVYIGGTFNSVGGVPANNIAVWNGTQWEAIGGGVDGQVNAIAIRPDGTIFVGGRFTRAAGQPSRGIARFIRACHCPADLDNGTNTGVWDGAVTIDDLLYFVTAFEQGTLSADLDNDGDPAAQVRDGAVTIDDMLFFLARFEAGC